LGGPSSFSPLATIFKPDECIAAVRAHAGQLSLAGEALGVSRGSVEQMVRRYPRVAKAARDAEARMTDIAVVQMHKLVLKGNYQACTFWLSSRIGRERGFAPPASDVGSGVAANTMLVGKVIINAIETGKFVDGDQLPIEGESVDAGVVHDRQTRKLA
jgi:hypothetical protein